MYDDFEIEDTGMMLHRQRSLVLETVDLYSLLLDRIERKDVKLIFERGFSIDNPKVDGVPIIEEVEKLEDAITELSWHARMLREKLQEMPEGEVVINDDWDEEDDKYFQ